MCNYLISKILLGVIHRIVETNWVDSQLYKKRCSSSLKVKLSKFVASLKEPNSVMFTGLHPPTSRTKLVAGSRSRVVRKSKSGGVTVELRVPLKRVPLLYRRRRGRECRCTLVHTFLFLSVKTIGRTFQFLRMMRDLGGV